MPETDYPTGDLKSTKSPCQRRRYPNTPRTRLIFTVFIIISNALVFENHLAEAAYCQGFSIQDLKAENLNLADDDVDDQFFTNPHLINLTWLEPDGVTDCTEVVVQMKLTAPPRLVDSLSSFIVKASEPTTSSGGYRERTATLSTSLSPAASYEVTIVDESTTLSNVATFSTVPMPPQMLSVEVDSQSQTFTVDITDKLNADKATLEYAIQVSNYGTEIPIDPRVIAFTNSPTTTADIPLSKLPKPGACLNKLTIVSHYTAPLNPSSDIPSEPTLPVAFVPPPVKVTNVDFTWSSNITSFKNPYSLNVSWNDESNCVGEVVLYNVEIHQLQPDGGENLLIATFRSSKTELLDIRVNLSPASRYVVNVVPFVGNNFGPAAASEKYLFTDPFPVQHIDFHVDSDKVTATIFDLENVDRISLVYELVISGNDGLFFKTYRVPAGSSITVFELPITQLSKLGACLYRVLATTYYTVPSDSSPASSFVNVTSETSLPHTFTTLPKPVSSVEVEVQSETSVTLRFEDSENCPPSSSNEDNPFYYTATLSKYIESDGSALAKHVVSVDVKDDSKQGTITVPVNSLQPACLYIVDVVARRKDGPYAEAKQSSPIPIAPKAPSELSISEVADVASGSIKRKLVVAVERDDENSISPQLTYDVTLNRVVNSTYSIQTPFSLTLGSLSKSFIFGTDLDFDGSCEYQAVAKSRFYGSQSTNTAKTLVLITNPVKVSKPIAEVTISQWGNSLGQSGTIDFSVDVTFSDSKNCPDSDVESEDGTKKQLEYQVTLKETLASSGESFNVNTQSAVTQFTLLNQRPGTSFKVTVLAIVKTMKGLTTLATMVSEESSTTFTVDPVSPETWLVDENSNHFTLGIYDPFNTKWQAETPSALSYAITPVAYKNYQIGGSTLEPGEISADLPYYLMAKPPKGGACYYNITSRSAYKDLHMMSPSYPTSLVLTTDPAAVQFDPIEVLTETLPTSGSTDGSSVLIEINWLDDLNCDQVGLLYDGVVSLANYRSWYDDDLNLAENVEVATETFEADEIRNTITKRVSANIRLTDIAPGCLFSVDVASRIKDLSNEEDGSPKYRTSQPASQTFISTPLPPSKLLVSDHNSTHILVEVGGDRRMTCFVDSQHPSFVVTVGMLSTGDTIAEIVTFNELYSQDDLTGKFTVEKPKLGACDYRVEAKTTSFGRTSSTTSTYLETGPVAAESASVAIVGYKDNVIKLIQGKVIDYKSLSVTIGWNDVQNCPDDGTNHIYHCSQIVEQERAVEILTAAKQPLCYGSSADGVTPSLKLTDVLKSEPNGDTILTPGCSYKAIVTVEHISKYSTAPKKVSLPATSSNEILIEPADVTDIKAAVIVVANAKLEFIISWTDEINCPWSDRIKYQATVYACVLNNCVVVEEKLISKFSTSLSSYNKTTFTVDPTNQPEGTIYGFRVASLLVKGSDSNEVILSSYIANLPLTQGTIIKLPVVVDPPIDPPVETWIFIVAIVVLFVVILSVIVIGYRFYRRRTRPNNNDTENRSLPQLDQSNKPDPSYKPDQSNKADPAPLQDVTQPNKTESVYGIYSPAEACQF